MRETRNMFCLGKLTIITLVLLGWNGCDTSLPPSNPYDPDTPLADQARARLAGLVLSAEDQSPLPGASVRLDGPSDLVDNPVLTAADGAFDFAELLPGLYTLTVSHPEHLNVLLPMDLGRGEQIRDVQVELELAEGLTDTTGRLTGQALKEAEQGLAVEEQDHSGVLVEVEGTGIRTVTNRAGTFDLFLQAGTYNLLYAAEDHHPTRSDEIAVLANQDNVLPEGAVVLLVNPGTVSGMVQLEGAGDGQHADVTVELSGSQNGLTAPDGSFTVGGVPAGSYTLVATKTGFDRQTLLGVVVEGGRETRVPELKLALARGAIHGLVQLAGQESHGGVTVELTGTNYRTPTSQTGEFLLTDIPVGVYELTATMGGYQRGVVAAVTVSSGQTSELADPLVLTSLMGDFAINDGASYTRLVLVELDFSRVQDAAQMKIGGQLANVDADFRAFAVRPQVELGAGDGLKLVEAYFRTDTGVESGPFTASITLDQTPPELAEISINEGAVYTNVISGVVNLSLSATDQTSGLKDFEVATSADGFVGQYQPLVATVTQVLDDLASQGSKSFFVHFRDHAGNQTPVPASDSIVYDTLPPDLANFSLDFDGAIDAAYCHSPLVTASVDSPDADRMRLSNQSGLPGAQFEPYAASRAWFLTPGDAEKTVYLELMDAAGNVAGEFVDSIILDSTAPARPQVSIAGGAVTTNTPGPNHTVAVTLVAPDAQQMRISTDGVWDNEVWTAFTSPVNVNLPTGDGEKTVWVELRDSAGNLSAEGRDEILLDTTAPQVLALSVGDGSGYVTSADGSTYVAVNCADNLALDAEMVLTIEESSAGILYQDDYLDWVVVDLGLSQGDKSLTATCADPAGNVANAGPVSVTLDFASPTVNQFSLNGGTAAEPTADRNIVVHVDVSDSVAGGVAVALSEHDLDCQAAQYTYAAVGNFDFTLSPGDGLRTVYLCARDAAGNHDPAEAAANTILLDTTPPPVPDLIRAAMDKIAIGIEWTPGGPDVAGFVLEQRLEGEAITAYVQVAAPGPGQSAASVPVSSENIGRHHYFRIRATDALGNSAGYSNELDAGVPIEAVAAVYRNTIDRRELVWNAPLGTVLSVATYGYQDWDGYHYQTPVANNAQSLELDSLDPYDLSGRNFNETLTIRNSNSDASLTWESTFLFGTLRLAIDSIGDVGQGVSMDLDSQGIAHISYLDSTNQNLEYMKLDNDCFADLPACPVTLNGTGTAGRTISLAIDSQDIAHIVYRDNGNQTIKYMKLNETCWQNLDKCPQTLDHQGSTPGYETALAIDSQDCAHLAFILDGKLSYQKLDGSSLPKALDDLAFGVDIAIDSKDGAHISYGYHDFGLDEQSLKYISVADGKAQQLATTAFEESNFKSSLAVDASDIVHIGYSSFDGGDFWVHYRKLDGFSPPLALDRAGGSASELDMVLDREQIAHLAYYDSSQHNLKYARLDQHCLSDLPNCPMMLDEIGEVGSYLSLAVDHAGVPRLAYYNASLDDLKYMRLEKTSEPRTLDSAGLVGTYSSLGVDSQGVAHVAYRDSTNKDLRYLKVDGVSSSLVLDAAGDVGLYAKLAVDGNDIAHIVYFDETADDLKYVKVEGAMNPLVLDSAGQVGWDPAIAIDANNIAHISYYQPANHDLKYIKLLDSCLADPPSCAQVLDGPDYVGAFSSIAVDSQGLAHITYYDDTNGDLKYVQADGVSSPVTLDSAGQVGRGITSIFDGDDILHICYFDTTNHDLKYLKLDGVSDPVVLDTDFSGYLGELSLAIDPSGIPVVAYYSDRLADLRYLRLDGFSSVQTLDKAGETGRFASLAFDRFGIAHVSYEDFDLRDLRYIQGRFLVPLEALLVEKR